MQHDSILFKVLGMLLTVSLANATETFLLPTTLERTDRDIKEKKRAFQGGSEAKERRSYQNNFYVFA